MATVIRVPVKDIRTSPLQVRQLFENLDELAESIKEVTLVEPIILRKDRDSKGYELIAGERRWRASKKAGISEIDAIVHEDISDFNAMLLSAVENIHRENLTSIERETLIQNLLDLGQKEGAIREGHGRYTDLGNRLGLSGSYIHQIIKAKETREAKKLGAKVSTRSIIQTLQLPEKEQTQLLDRIKREEIGASQVQEFVSTMKKVSEPTKKAMLKPKSRITSKVAQQIERIPTKEGRKKAITQIEKAPARSTEPLLETIVEEIGVQERLKQLSLSEFMDERTEGEVQAIGMAEIEPEKEILGRLSVQFFPYVHQDDFNLWRVRRVGDGSIIEIYEALPEAKTQTSIICPQYLKLKWATGCPFECAWCYLQGTLRFKEIKTNPSYKNRDEITQHIQCFIQGTARPEILNTGELGDSLMDEESKGKEPFSKFIIKQVKKHRSINQTRHKVLFLTRSDYIENLLQVDGQDVAICSFTVNAPEVAKRWEHKAPSVQKRLEAAKRLKDAGYEVRLRIDPMVPIVGWEKGYLDMIDLIFKYLIPDRITLGSLRGFPSTVQNTKDTSWTQYLSEQSDLGLRVPFNTRYTMYKTVIEKLRKKYIYTTISLCKETLAMWTKLGMDFRRPMCNCIS
ncbi:MAG: spore photoproduct lyase family protein [Promethearchaeota archaeon]